jgi:hypothetical protein
MRRILSVLLVLAAVAEAQSPTIEVRKVRTLVDRDGKGFTRAPWTVAPIAGGQYAIGEMNEIPLVVDSTGRLMKRWVRGDGPGEFAGFTAGMRRGPGDTLYAMNQGNINVFGPDLRFQRTIPLPGMYAGQFLPIDEGFIVASQKFSSPTTMTSLHIVGRDGKLIRSFLTDSNVDRRSWPPPPGYRLGRGTAGSIWAASTLTHRIERWTLNGERALVIDRRPSWFVIAPTFGNTANVRSIHEAGGVLWVMSNVPVPNAREIERAAMAKVPGRSEADARAIPFERLETAYLEAYDASTGALLADIPLGKYGITILDDVHFMVHSFSADDTSQLEIWEMKLRR